MSQVIKGPFITDRGLRASIWLFFCLLYVLFALLHLYPISLSNSTMCFANMRTHIQAQNNSAGEKM